MVPLDRGSPARRPVRRPHIGEDPRVHRRGDAHAGARHRAVTVIYSVVRNVVLDPFPYSRSDRLVNVVLRDGADRIVRGPYFPLRSSWTIRSRRTAFEDVVGTSRDSMLWHERERHRTPRCRVDDRRTASISWESSRCSAARSTRRDAAPGAPPVAVMCHRAWVRSFGADPRRDRAHAGARRHAVDGRRRHAAAVRVEHRRSVASRGDQPQLTIRAHRGATRAFQAHLRPGVSPKEAEAQMNVIGARRARNIRTTIRHSTASRSSRSSTGSSGTSAPCSTPCSAR